MTTMEQLCLITWTEMLKKGAQQYAVPQLFVGCLQQTLHIGS